MTQSAPFRLNAGGTYTLKGFMTDKPETNSGPGCLTALALLALFVPLTFYYGWALWLLWNWFLVPLLPAVTWHAAVGMVLVGQLLRIRPSTRNASDRETWHGILVVQTSVLTVVGAGWLLHALGFGFPPAP